MNAWEPMNKEEVATLFANEAVLFGRVDGIPINRAAQIFGTDAIQFAQRMENREKGTSITNGYGIGGYTAFYLTISGAQIAATFNNVSLIKQQEEEQNAQEVRETTN